MVPAGMPASLHSWAKRSAFRGVCRAGQERGLWWAEWSTARSVQRSLQGKVGG